MPEVLEGTVQSQIELKDADVSLNDSEIVLESCNGIHFKLPVFEGPLDLLLHLIKESKIDIYDIPIVNITQQYLGYIELMKELDLEIAGEFLVMAATLIHIKSRMLLPPDEEAKEEPSEDPRSELVRRLLEYQTYKESSLQLRKREEIWKDIFRRNVPDKNDFEFEPEPLLFDANVFDLISAFKKLLEKAPEQAVEITRESLTIADRINYIIERVDKERGVRFEDLFKEGFTKITLIVTFLALLEIIRLGLAKIYQEKAFGLIWILNPEKEAAISSAEAAQEEVTQEAATEPSEALA
ncbi:MAG: segregation/condensation protein A [Nitrospirae bacterium]|nr:segregation/condensation protein A [Nitrospirota bacterium]